MIKQSECGYTTKTSSGTFTVYNQLLDRCSAKKFCEKKGHILAPITTTEDKEAVWDLLNIFCKIHQGVRYYHIGLDITPRLGCGGGQDRVFTNGVKYDKDIHGHLYDDTYITTESKCPLAYMHYFFLKNDLIIGTKTDCKYNGEPEPMKFLCLDQSTATSSPVTQDNADYFKLNTTQALAAVGGIVCVVGSLAFATAKFYKLSKMLKKEVKVLKEEKNME